MAKEQEPKRIDAPTSMVAAPQAVDNEKLVEQPELSEYKGKYRNLKDGYLYQMAVKDHPAGKTHKAIVPRQEAADGTLIHTGLFWEGTKEEFKAQFEKE